MKNRTCLSIALAALALAVPAAFAFTPHTSTATLTEDSGTADWDAFSWVWASQTEQMSITLPEAITSGNVLLRLYREVYGDITLEAGPFSVDGTGTNATLLISSTNIPTWALYYADIMQVDESTPVQYKSLGRGTIKRSWNAWDTTNFVGTTTSVQLVYTYGTNDTVNWYAAYDWVNTYSNLTPTYSWVQSYVSTSAVTIAVSNLTYYSLSSVIATQVWDAAQYPLALTNAASFDAAGTSTALSNTLGTAAFTASTNYATAAQGDTADSAVQPTDTEYTNTVELASGALPKAGGTMTGPITGLTDLSGTGRRVFGTGLSVVNIDATAAGASQSGYTDISGTRTIGASAHGASQSGENYGTQTIGASAYGANQSGGNDGTQTIGASAYGANQSGLNAGTMIIGLNAIGANQQGYVAPTATATNNAIAGLQLLNLTSGQHALTEDTATASILLGAGTATHKQSITIGDGNTSAGEGWFSGSGISVTGNLTAATASVTGALDAGSVEADSYALTGNKRAISAAVDLSGVSAYTNDASAAFTQYSFGTNTTDFTLYLTGPGTNYMADATIYFASGYTNRAVTITNATGNLTWIGDEPTTGRARFLADWIGTNVNCISTWEE